MAMESHSDELLVFKNVVEERAKILRTVADISSSMRETYVQTRGLITESLELIRKADRLLRRD
jgi:hypothetical protein